MTRRRSRRLKNALVSATALTLAGVMVAPTASASHTGLNRIGAFDFGYAAIPAEIDSNHRFDFRFANAGGQPHEIVVLKLAPEHEDATIEEAIAAADSGDETFTTGFAGFAFAVPGQVVKAALRPDQPGRYVYYCFLTDAASGLPHYALEPGMVGFIDAV